MKKIKKLLAIAGIAIVMGTIGAVNVSAEEKTDTTWAMNLLPASLNNTDKESWNTYNANGGSISLTRIVGGPSYHCKARAANALNSAKSSWALCEQGGGSVKLKNITMVEGYEYKVQAYNYKIETAYRWAYGNFYW